MIISVIGYFFGSTPGDFDQQSDEHPFPACSCTPNCTIHSVKYQINDQKLFEAAESAVRQLSPHKPDYKSDSLRIDAVFRIPVFGFKDDVNIMIKSAGPGQSILYIKSASRTGRSDLGVNRRRIKRILKTISRQL